VESKKFTCYLNRDGGFLVNLRLRLPRQLMPILFGLARPELVVFLRDDYYYRSSKNNQPGFYELPGIALPVFV
jgi:hypothetical protein